MTTWNQCQHHYDSIFETFQDYLETQIANVNANTIALGVQLAILQKFQINMICARDFIPYVSEDQKKFLSLGLVLRGIISDVINYRYLNKVRTSVGLDEFEIESKVLDRDFVEAYGKMIGQEAILASADQETKTAIAASFQNQFGALHVDNKLMTGTQIRNSETFKANMSAYLQTINKPDLHYAREAGKLQFVVDDDSSIIEILYKYLSQLQHFSLIGRKMYTMDGFLDFNPHITLLTLFLMAKVIRQIALDVAPHQPTLTALDTFINAFV
ncbi:MAG TPA: hypothetical protein VK658_08745 [Chryseolinea sp.]|nr:hypothetical protein [Chryseolinea sp.]